MTDTIFSHTEYEKLLKDVQAEIEKLAKLKGGEYAGDTDRLANFRRNANDLDLPMETVWRVYCAKHWDAVGQYIKDIQSGKSRERIESIEGRAMDIIVYMTLFIAMVRERDRSRPSLLDDYAKQVKDARPNQLFGTPAFTPTPGK